MLNTPSKPISSRRQEIHPASRLLGDLPCYRCAVEAATPAEEIITKLQNQPDLPGVLIYQDGAFWGALSRLKILEWLGRPFGIELFFKKPIQALCSNLNLAGEIYPSRMRIDEAVKQALARPASIMYEPVTVSFPGAELRLLDMHVLLLAQSHLLSTANRTIEKQMEIGKVLSSTIELPQVLALILEQVNAIVPYHRASIMLYQRGEMEFAASRGYPASVDMSQARVTVNSSEIFKTVMDSQRPAVLEDASLRRDWQHIPGISKTRAWLGVPLVHAGETLGMLSISRLTVTPFSPDEVEAAQLFASQASTALVNANLYNQVQIFNTDLGKRVKERTQELQKANQKLELLNRNKSDFIKIVSHELKTPITVAVGYAQMLRSDQTLDLRQQGLAQGVADGMKRLDEIVNTMLDVARLDTQEMQLNPEELLLSDMFARLQASVEKEIIGREIALNIKNMRGLPPVKGDAESLPKAFYHLLMNAIKFTPDGGQVTVYGRTPGIRNGKIYSAFIQISVADTGVGIDAQNLELIFDKFYQTGKVMQHSSSRTGFKGGGPGLGLSVARGIVEAHGGQIWAESAEYNEATLPGSTFHVLLPSQRIRVEI